MNHVPINYTQDSGIRIYVVEMYSTKTREFFCEVSFICWYT